MSEVRVSGFTIVRNAIKFGYPVKEAILSVLPLCDEFVVLVGNSDDGTRQLIESISDPRIKIFDSVWDDSLREGGKVLAVETDKAMRLVSAQSHWAFYIQADEVLHEHGYQALRDAMLKYRDDQRIEGLLLRYRHFYGSYDYLGDSRKWYRNEIRVVKNNLGIQSFRDAQGFRLKNKALRVKPVYAFMHHYGWVRPPKTMQAKEESFHRMWHSDEWVSKNVAVAAEFDYTKIDSLSLFKGTHPEVMRERIASMNWKFSFDPSRKKRGLVATLLYWVEELTGWRPGEYKNYKQVKG
ncbi:MAG: glycosyltransferase family 2 protein [Bacteroidota bacterium]